MVRSFDSDISVAIPGALIPPVGIILLHYFASHYLFLTDPDNTQAEMAFQATLAFFTFPLIIVYTQYRLESESEYKLVIEPRGISLFEKFQEERQKCVGFIHKDNIKGISFPEYQSESWFFYWMYFSLKFLRLQKLVFSKNIVIHTAGNCNWPDDLASEDKVMIPFYLGKVEKIAPNLKHLFQ